MTVFSFTLEVFSPHFLQFLLALKSFKAPTHFALLFLMLMVALKQGFVDLMSLKALGTFGSFV